MYYIFQVNVALNKLTYQLHPYKLGNNKYDASKAVDGHKSDLRGLQGQCVLSANTQQIATWRVNLGRIHSIHRITIYYRTENLEWGT